MGTDFDFDELAASFDRILPTWQPVTDRIGERLGPLAPGASVLDIACGTGEPGLTLRERDPGIRLLGVDAADTMVAAAARKAVARGLDGARFASMDSRKLDVEDGSVDAVVSRFGVLSFVPDPRAEAREVARVLRPGGTFAIAAWAAPTENLISYALVTGLREWLPPAIDAALRRQEQYAMPGRREAWLRDAGLTVNGETFGWPVEFADRDALWDFADDPVFLGPVAGHLDAERLAHVREVLLDLLDDYRGADGSYVLPYACRILWGAR
ncbi:hypothetical protein Val02_51390 [Virgisporangium aliadipatigenens]|uniref:Methyltransferase domain-containing protein n=1 Tax=Virgisporangium aliadipatigenens TaxID=741659 RepID=A0A8J4DSU7_9ACTN|nr:class I SAM-dependent methyltransferase [Virgisporangium aliadipatigenens]GIJ48253.1 hypothetical protein Val02_51390 [Virgisporangium aliadipatigenens]